jgi:hypothetical protein
MKSYLQITGGIFALVAVAHLLRTVAEWSRMTTDPWGFAIEGPGLGIAAAALCWWALTLLRRERSWS